MKVVKKDPQQSGERKLWVGLEDFRIVAVNPTIKEINKLYDKESTGEEEEPVYVDEKDGKDRVIISVYLQGQSSHRIAKKSFFIVDKERVSYKHGEDNPTYQFINQVCQTSWANNEDNLKDGFTKFLAKDKKTVIAKKSYRKAKDGEGDFYEFVRSVMRGVDYFNPETEVIFKWKDFLKGNFKELKEHLLDESITFPFTGLNNVVTKYDDEGNKQQYNDVYIRQVLRNGFSSKILMKVEAYVQPIVEEIKADPSKLAKYGIPEMPTETLTIWDIVGYLTEPHYSFKNDKYLEKDWEAYKNSVEGEYGCKGFYKLTPVFEYNPSMDIAAGESIVQSATDSSY